MNHVYDYKLGDVKKKSGPIALKKSTFCTGERFAIVHVDT